MERENVLNNIWEKGGRLFKKIQNIIDKYDVGAELSGVAPMFFITFKKNEENTQKSRRDDFYTQLIRKGFFFTPHHHAYISYRHTEEDLDKSTAAIDEAMAYVKEKYQK
jgi:glutamate-1-semialdehyde aminotransferase